MKDYDIFISYARPDNETLEGVANGWITNFQKFLEISLEKILGRKPVILFSKNHENPPASLLQKVKVLICILSPAYVKSSYSIEDLNIFLESNKKEAVGKVFKVVKSPVTIDQVPTYLKNLPGYILYQKDLETGETFSSLDFTSLDDQKAIGRSLLDLTLQLGEVIKGPVTSGISISPNSLEKPAIYLAQTSVDKRPERDYIKKELENYGYRVLPAMPYPSNVKELEAEIKKNLEHSLLSIHLLGDAYGEYLPEKDISLIELEYKLAAEYNNYILANNDYNDHTKSFGRFIWVSPENKKRDELQRKFIDELVSDTEGLEGAEIIQTPIEDLRFIIKKLLVSSSFFKKENIKKATQLKLYLIFDKVDSYECRTIISFFKENNIEILTPSFEGDLLALRTRHIENLKTCDVALIYSGKVQELWVKMKVLDILKSAGLGRVAPLLAKAIYMTEESKINKQDYAQFDIDILEKGESFQQVFQPLLIQQDKIIYE